MTVVFKAHEDVVLEEYDWTYRVAENVGAKREAKWLEKRVTKRAPAESYTMQESVA